MKGFPLELVFPVLYLLFAVYYGIGWLMTRRFRKRYGLTDEGEASTGRRNQLIAGGLAALAVANVALFLVL